MTNKQKNDVKSGHATQSKSNITYNLCVDDEQSKVDVKSGHANQLEI